MTHQITKLKIRTAEEIMVHRTTIESLLRLSLSL